LTKSVNKLQFVNYKFFVKYDEFFLYQKGYGEKQNKIKEEEKNTSNKRTEK